MRNITAKEAWIALVVAIVVLAISVLINPWAMQRVQGDIRDHRRALKIDQDAQQFQYAELTKVGNVLAYGRMLANEGQSIPELIGEYSIVERVTEEYTRHERLVCASNDKDGNCERWETEVSYSWDTYDHEKFESPSYTFLGVTFQSENLYFPSLLTLLLNRESVSANYIGKLEGQYIYEETGFWDSVGDKRWYYNVLPIQYNASVYVGFFTDGYRKPATVSYEQTPADVLEQLNKRARFFNIAYYALILLIAEGLYLWLAYEVIEIE